MIYVTGDTHGDLERFKSKQASKLKKGDTLVICGDFGFIWDGSKTEEKTLNWLSHRRYKILFVEGAHENYLMLDKYELEDYCGGRARHIAKNIYMLRRGDVFDIEGRKLFAFGGGDDEEIDLMDLEEEPVLTRLPNDEDVARARDSLAAVNNNVDYIITYDTGFKLKSFLQMEQNSFNNLHAFLDEISRTCTFGKWFFGCYHMDKRIPPNYYGVYRSILNAQTGEEIGK